jgi:hypothetical protein
MARPTKEDSVYRLSPHKNGKYMYASTHPFTLTQDNKRKYRLLHWGTLTPELKFIPGKQYLYASMEERGKLIFPEGWDLSEIDKLASNRKQGRVAHEGEDLNRLYGDIWLLERIAESTGLRKDLTSVFDGNAEMVNDILTLAYYPIVTGNNYSRVARWQRIVKTPSRSELYPAMITRLSQSITEQHRMDLFRLRAQRLGKDELCAVDSTSRSAYGSSLADIHWGRNKEHLPLEQTTSLVVYSLTTHMPVYYREFPGNIPDSRSVETLLTEVEHAGFPRVVFITDRGYESIQNMERYILRGQPMIISVSVHQDLVLKRILEFGVIDGRPEGMDIDVKTRVYYKQYDIDYKVKGNGDTVHEADRMRLNLYFNAVRRGEDLSALDASIEAQRQALQEIKDKGLALDDDATVKRNYNWFIVKYNEQDRTVLSFSINEKKVSKARRAAGFFANITLGLDKTPMEAMRDYKIRDEQEKYFRQMKSQLCFDRQRCWSEEGKNGMLFILFVSMILASQVKHVWKTKLEKQFATSLDVLDEMRAIRCIEHKGRKSSITPFVGAQLDICEAFGFDVPEGCAPKYRSKRVEPKRRGRPRKQRTETLEH